MCTLIRYLGIRRDPRHPETAFASFFLCRPASSHWLELLLPPSFPFLTPFIKSIKQLFRSLLSNPTTSYKADVFVAGLLIQCHFSSTVGSCACTLLNNYSGSRTTCIAFAKLHQKKTIKETKPVKKLQSARVASCSPLLLWGNRKSIALAPASDVLPGFVWIGMKLALSRSARTRVWGNWIPFDISSKQLWMVGNKKLFAFQQGYVVFAYRIKHTHHVKI